MKVEDHLSRPRMWLRRGAWFCLLWLIGVSTLMALALIIRAALA